jgi:hypothetical protein
LCNDLIYEANKNFHPSNLSTRRLLLNLTLEDNSRLPTLLANADTLFVCGIKERDLELLKQKLQGREFIQFQSNTPGREYISVLIRVKQGNSGGG